VTTHGITQEVVCQFSVHKLFTTVAVARGLYHWTGVNGILMRAVFDGVIDVSTDGFKYNNREINKDKVSPQLAFKLAYNRLY